MTPRRVWIPHLARAEGGNRAGDIQLAEGEWCARAGKEEVEGPAAKSVRYRWRVAEVTAAVVTRGYTAVQSAPVMLWTKDALLALEEDSAADVQVRAV